MSEDFLLPCGLYQAGGEKFLVKSEKVKDQYKHSFRVLGFFLDIMASILKLEFFVNCQNTVFFSDVFSDFFSFLKVLWFLFSPSSLSQKFAGQNLQAQVMDLMHRTLTPEDVRGIFCWGASDFEAQNYTPQKINILHIIMEVWGSDHDFLSFSWVMAVGCP